MANFWQQFPVESLMIMCLNGTVSGYFNSASMWLQLIIYVCVLWWCSLMKAQCKHIYQSSNINKKHQAVLPSVWEQQCFLLLLWQQDKVPFQLEQYLATYRPKPAFFFSAIWAEILVVMVHHHQIHSMHILMQTQPLHLDTKWWKKMWLFLCIFSHFGLAFMKVRLHKIMLRFVGGKGGGGEKERVFAFCMRSFMLLSAFGLMSFLLRLSVVCASYKDVHMYMLNSRC